MPKAEQHIEIVVPCYNESGRLDLPAFLPLLKEPGVRLSFVDDGSTDDTSLLIESFASGHDSVSLLRLARNVGKGEAVRGGLRNGIARGATLVAYLDADLATPANEMRRLLNLLQSSADTDVVLGSRVALLGSTITRKASRHITGRVFATLASLVLGIAVYDTQCGAKAFRVNDRLVEALEHPFCSRWAFDVEMLARLTIGTPTDSSTRIVEIPLREWSDIDGSRMTAAQKFVALFDLLAIWRKHRFSGRYRSGRCQDTYQSDRANPPIWREENKEPSTSHHPHKAPPMSG